jgi:amidase
MLTHLTASEMAAAIRARRVTAAELLEAHLAHIERLNPALNAIVALSPAARDEARAADAALARGEATGPLHGVPVTIKDAFDTAGLRTTSAYEPLAERIPDSDASTVGKLRAAGAIVIGKTNLPALADDLQTDNALFGRTNNPWDTERIAGGSSGGEAAAIAARMSPLGLGSDWGGSIRHPAHCCGIFGLKPTENLVSTAGYGEGLGRPNAVRHMNTAGPLARSVGDLELALRVIAGPDGRYFETPPADLPPGDERALRTLRVAWTAELPGARPSREIREGIAGLAKRLDGLVARIEETRAGGYDHDEALRAAWLVARFEFEVTTGLRLGAVHSLASSADDVPRVSFDFGEYAAALALRDRVAFAWDRFLDDWDVFICPVSLVPAPRHLPKDTPIDVDGESVPYLLALGAQVELQNFTGHPAVALPLGLSAEGIPFGYQAVGRRWRDIELLRTAETLALVSGPAPMPAL